MRICGLGVMLCVFGWLIDVGCCFRIVVLRWFCCALLLLVDGFCCLRFGCLFAVVCLKVMCMLAGLGC